MKSVTIKDKRTGKIVFKVIRKSSGYEMTIHTSDTSFLDIDVRDDNNRKIHFK